MENCQNPVNIGLIILWCVIIVSIFAIIFVAIKWSGWDIHEYSDPIRPPKRK